MSDRYTPESAFHASRELLKVYEINPVTAGVNWMIQEEETDLTPPRLLETLRSAAIVLWRQDFWQAAQARNEVFQGAPVNQAIRGTAPQFWFIEGGAGPLDSPEWRKRLELPPFARFLCMAVVPCTALGAPAVTPVMIYLASADEPIQDAAHRLPYWRTFAPQRLDEPIHRGFHWVAAPLTFIDQEFVGRLHHPHERQVRRWHERKKKPLPDVYTIQLRRSFQGEKGEGSGEAREYGCSWLVSGHWRKQWYPSVAEWRPKYISPYLKGDPDKPLRQPKGTVYVVNR